LLTERDPALVLERGSSSCSAQPVVVKGSGKVRDRDGTGRTVKAADEGLTTLSDVAGVSPDEAPEAGEVYPEALTDPEVSVLFPDLRILVEGRS
jgi:hypothetical protein